MLVADSRHDMARVLNELAKSCAPYATTQQQFDYSKLPSMFYARRLLAHSSFYMMRGGTDNQDPSKTKFTKVFLERLMQAGIKFRLLVRLSCVHLLYICANG